MWQGQINGWDEKLIRPDDLVDVKAFLFRSVARIGGNEGGEAVLEADLQSITGVHIGEPVDLPRATEASKLHGRRRRGGVVDPQQLFLNFLQRGPDVGDVEIYDGEARQISFTDEGNLRGLFSQKFSDVFLGVAFAGQNAGSHGVQINLIDALKGISNAAITAAQIQAHQDLLGSRGLFIILIGEEAVLNG